MHKQKILNFIEVYTNATLLHFTDTAANRNTSILLEFEYNLLGFLVEWVLNPFKQKWPRENFRFLNTDFLADQAKIE